MAIPSDLRPRPIYEHETPARGDIHFAVGFGKSSATVSRIIAAGTASRTNHVAIITGVSEKGWDMVEALAKGVVKTEGRTPPVSTVIRVSDDPAVREQVAAEAEGWLSPHVGYDWATIARIVFVGLVGRIPFFTVPLLVAPPLARYTDPVWVAPVVAAVLMVVLYRARNLLYKLAMAMPWVDQPDRMICSELGRRVIEQVFGTAAVPGLARIKPISMTSPGDLFQELLFRRDYGSAAGPVRVAAPEQTAA